MNVVFRENDAYDDMR